MTEDDSVGSTGERDDDVTYLRSRAEWHRHRADVANDDSTRALHRKFATLYQARAEG